MASVELVSRLCVCPQGDAGRHGIVGEKGPNGLPVSVLHQGPTFLVKKFNMNSFKSSLLFAHYWDFFCRAFKERLAQRGPKEEL